MSENKCVPISVLSQHPSSKKYSLGRKWPEKQNAAAGGDNIQATSDVRTSYYFQSKCSTKAYNACGFSKSQRFTDKDVVDNVPLRALPNINKSQGMKGCAWGKAQRFPPPRKSMQTPGPKYVLDKTNQFETVFGLAEEGKTKPSPGTSVAFSKADPRTGFDLTTAEAFGKNAPPSVTGGVEPHESKYRRTVGGGPYICGKSDRPPMGKMFPSAGGPDETPGPNQYINSESPAAGRLPTMEPSLNIPSKFNPNSVGIAFDKAPRNIEKVLNEGNGLLAMYEQGMGMALSERVQAFDCDCK